MGHTLHCGIGHTLHPFEREVNAVSPPLLFSWAFLFIYFFFCFFFVFCSSINAALTGTEKERRETAKCPPLFNSSGRASARVGGCKRARELFWRCYCQATSFLSLFYSSLAQGYAITSPDQNGETRERKSSETHK